MRSDRDEKWDANPGDSVAVWDGVREERTRVIHVIAERKKDVVETLCKVKGILRRNYPQIELPFVATTWVPPTCFFCIAVADV